MDQYRSLMIATAAMLLLLDGCVSTSLVYSPNVYQTGWTARSDGVRVRGSVESTSRIETSPENMLLMTELPAPQQWPSLALGIEGQLAPHVDGGIEVNALSSIGGRLWLKAQLTRDDLPLAMAFMPALVAIDGIRDDDDQTGERIRSGLVGLELPSVVCSRIRHSPVMIMEPRIPIDYEQIREFCEKWKIVEFSLFGSVLTDDFRPDSDVDVLVTFAEDAK